MREENVIIFEGRYSNQAIQFMLKKNSIMCSAVASIVAVIGTIVVLVISYMLDLWALMSFLVAFVFMIGIVAIAPFVNKKQTIEAIAPRRVVVDEDKQCINKTLRKSSVVIQKSFNCLRCVIDYGKWYYLKFKFPKLDGFVCQKEAIAQGNTEEFEKIFAGKIVRKLKKERHKSAK